MEAPIILISAILTLLLLLGGKKLLQHVQRLKWRNNIPKGNHPSTPPSTPTNSRLNTPQTSPCSPPLYPPLLRSNAMPRVAPLSHTPSSSGHSSCESANSRRWNLEDLRPRRLFSDPNPETALIED